MCGIHGFIDYQHRSSPDILRRATDRLTHRGPDGSDYHFESLPGYQLGLGHRRLSIIDLSHAAQQPMRYRHYTLVYNGEIYNFREIRRELEGLGHAFVTQSDTEIILHAWEQWGTEMVHRFIGMFAFVIHDAQAQKLICFRDRAGVKPFYYYWHEGLFLFGSELKSFHDYPHFRKSLHLPAVHQFFQYGYILAPLTIFEHTHKLPQGHYMELDLVRKQLDIRCYWSVTDLYLRPKLNISEEEAEEQLHALLRSACDYRMVSDVPVGVFLSGGYDSTAVTALLQSGRSERIKTFTIGFHEEDHNEAVYAAQVARHLGTDHTEYYCTSREAQDIIPEIPRYCDEPFGDSSIIPTTLVSRLARKQVTVALSADAGDEVFSGYPKYPMALDFHRKMTLFPHPLRSLASRVLPLIPDSLLIGLTGNPAVPIKKERFGELLRYKNLTTTDILDVLFSQVYTDRQMDRFLAHPTTPAGSFFRADRSALMSSGNLDRMLAVDYKTYMVDDILVKVDRAGMSTSLEGREPLLDHRIVDFASLLPEDLKLRKGEKKYLLRKIVHQYVPPSIMDRPKMGFGVPVHRWLKNDLSFYLDTYMSRSAFEAHGLFRPEATEHVIRRFHAGDKNYNSFFWYLLMFQMWHKTWMQPS